MWTSRKKRLTAAGLILIGIVIGIVLTVNFNWIPKGIASRNTTTVDIGSKENSPQARFDLQSTAKAFTAVAKRVVPTVVRISPQKTITRRVVPFDDLFRQFFDFKYKPQKREDVIKGLGSGVIISSDGYILTNNHVVADMDELDVTLPDNRSFKAKLIGTDPLTEIAVIKIDGKNLPTAKLGNSDELEVGEWVLAVGSPLGEYLSSTVTAGIVSALGRNINIIRDVETSPEYGSYAIENFIQTDAAINPGNSGGPLVNLKGEVVGINTAIATGTGFYAGYGFAVPINLAKKIASDLIEKGYVVRAFLGISMTNVDENKAKRFGLDKPTGVLIEKVQPGSPAEKAGLQQFDIILEIDGKKVNASNQVQSYIALKNPGDFVEITILRNRLKKTIKIKLGQRETGKEKPKKQEQAADFPDIGIVVKNLDDQYRQQYGIDEGDEGVIVVDIERYGPAWKGGIRNIGTLITKIENYKIRSTSDYRKALRKFKKGSVVIFYLRFRGIDSHAFVEIPD